MMSRQHKPPLIKNRSKRRTVAELAKSASDIDSTYSATSQSSSDSTGNAFSRDIDNEVAVDVTSINRSKRDFITWDDVRIFWRNFKVLIGILITVGGFIWSLSQLSSKVENNGESIKKIIEKTDKLIIDSNTSTVKLDQLDKRVNRLEGETFIRKNDSVYPKK